MTNYLNQTAALIAALFITVASFNAIVTVPAAGTAAIAAPILA